jgi:hypothetical protein
MGLDTKTLLQSTSNGSQYQSRSIEEKSTFTFETGLLQFLARYEELLDYGHSIVCQSQLLLSPRLKDQGMQNGQKHAKAHPHNYNIGVVNLIGV